MKTLIISGLFVLLCGCALNQPREFDPDLCVKSAAFEAGYNDGLSPFRSLDSGFLNRCREDLREEARKGYQEGYQKGHDEMLARQREQREDERRRAEMQQPPPGSDPALINNGININIGTGGEAMPARKWYCKVEAFTQSFEGFGPTQFEAKREAMNSCKTQYHEMHCNDATCELVR